MIVCLRHIETSTSSKCLMTKTDKMKMKAASQVPKSWPNNIMGHAVTLPHLNARRPHGNRKQLKFTLALIWQANKQ